MAVSIMKKCLGLSFAWFTLLTVPGHVNRPNRGASTWYSQLADGGARLRGHGLGLEDQDMTNRK